MPAKISGVGQFQEMLRTRTTRVRDEAAEIAEDAAEYGADLMREYIATRGTGYVGKGARATPEGRIDTGRMYDAVGVDPVRVRKSDIVVSFGWTEDAAAYFLQQENEPTRGGHPPMHALLDAKIQAREYFYAELKRRFK
jgi:hypothetical protein